VDPRTGLDDVEKRKFLTLPGLELRPLGRPLNKVLKYRVILTYCRGPIIDHGNPDNNLESPCPVLQN
jgi:hypothetical protein